MITLNRKKKLDIEMTTTGGYNLFVSFISPLVTTMSHKDLSTLLTDINVEEIDVFSREL